MTDPLEQFWNDILSRDAKRTRAVFATISDEDKTALIAHLRKMVTEDGWHTEQIRSAQLALLALGESMDPTSTFIMRRPDLDK